MSSVDPGTEPPGRQRWDFVGAFVENSWTRPGSERSSAKPHILLTMATVAAVIALATGVVLQLVAPVRLTTTAVPVATVLPTTGFTAVAGWDCAATATSGFEATGRQSTWSTVASGGWAQDGCHGTFEVMPMIAATGTSSDVDGPSAVWWFVPRGATRCGLAVYVPRPDPASYRPATAAQFYVLSGRSGQRFAQFVVDQSARPGTWTEVGTYPANGNGIAVLMVSLGQPAGAHPMLAITQVRAACTS